MSQEKRKSSLLTSSPSAVHPFPHRKTHPNTHSWSSQEWRSFHIERHKRTQRYPQEKFLSGKSRNMGPLSSPKWASLSLEVKKRNVLRLIPPRPPPVLGSMTIKCWMLFRWGAPRKSLLSDPIAEKIQAFSEAKVGRKKGTSKKAICNKKVRSSGSSFSSPPERIKERKIPWTALLLGQNFTKKKTALGWASFGTQADTKTGSPNCASFLAKRDKKKGTWALASFWQSVLLETIDRAHPHFSYQVRNHRNSICSQTEEHRHLLRTPLVARISGCESA